MIGLGNSVVKRKLAGASVPAAPVNIVQPSLSGSGAVGEAVICNDGSWTGNPTPTYTDDFRLDSVSVQNSSSNSYTPLLADDGKTLTCLVTATNSQGSASEGTSNSLVIGVAPSNTVAPTLSPSGTQSTGTVITVGNGTFSGTAPLTYAYRWKRNGSIILGETTNTYTIVAGDDGTVITAEVKATNAYGESAYIGTSNQVDAVNAIAPVNTVAPVVSGTAVVGQTLSTTDGTWTGTAPITYSYQWYRGATLISGATNSTYTLVQADAGNTSNIKCVVTATNSAGSASADSNTVAQVLDANAYAYLISDTFSNTSMIAATNNLFISAKSKGYFSSLRVLYNWKNANSSLNKWNMLNPVDSDAAFRAGFFGSITHGTSGLVGTAANVYVRSYFNTSNLSLNSGTIGQYHAADSTTGTWICGCVSGSNRFDVGFDAPRQLFVAINTTGSDVTGAASRQGLLLGTRRASNVVTGKVNKTLVVNSARVSMTNPNLEIYFMARNNGGAFQIPLQNIPVPMAVIADGLTSQQENDLTDDLNTFIAAW